ncbi:30S ribosomal protein S7 [Candidatus Woesearchaeota archaeon]|nr:30S ribosomal protein S7 [Candidatus Woesearchaeota archaeon]
MAVLVYNRWSTDGIQVEDPGLKAYMNIQPRVVPRTGGKSAKFRFHKSQNVFILERFMNRLMNSGHKAKKHIITSYTLTGKGHTVYNIMEDALEIIEARTKQNPVAVVVKAVENAAPREEIVTIEYGGAKYPKAVEVAPQRRIDQALKYMTQNAHQKAFNSKKSIAAALADEIINAFNMSGQSGAIAKKLEMERQADSSR